MVGGYYTMNPIYTLHHTIRTQLPSTIRLGQLNEMKREFRLQSFK